MAANSLDASSDRDFVARVRLRAGDDRRAPEHLGRGVDPLVHGRVRLPQAAAGLLHRLVDHAAEGQSGRAGADPRQDGPGDRQFADPAGAGQGAAAGLQPRFAGRQAAAVRLVRYGPGVVGAGCAVGGRGGVEPPGDRRAAGSRPPGRDHADGALDSAGAFRSGRPTSWSAGWCARPWTAACGWRICRWTISAQADAALDEGVYGVLGAAAGGGRP